ncbi:MAG: phosphoadenylyl-sulfate reductase [Bacteroidales bacterium]|nr:phosphoadenylyl-sulfate reductase [Bacteroidales bacterium]
MEKQTLDNYNLKFAGSSPRDILDYFLKKYRNELAFSTSFGAEDQVITQIISSTGKNAGIFTLDTGRMFPETYEVMEKTISRYKINIQTYFPDQEKVEKMVNTHGINLFYRSVENRKLCCSIRKTEQLHRALKGKKAWVTGLRKEQSVTRKNMQIAEWDDAFGLLKINPLCYWTEEQVWNYIREHNIPYNKLHDKGFRSIGCQPCTMAVEVGEDVRAGRWWWENPESKECGLHVR